MNYVIVYPPNTKDAQAIAASKFAVIVKCPHCGKEHHHPKIDRFKACVTAPCGQGHYVIRMKP